MRWRFQESEDKYILLPYLLYKVFIQASGLACEVYVEVSSLRSLPTTVCAAADSVVYQVTLLPSNNGLRHSEQYCVLDHYAPFLHW